MHLLMFACFIAAIIQGGFIVLSGNYRLLKTLSTKQIARAFISGILNPFLYYLVLLKAYDLLPAQEAGTLNYFWPITLVLFSIFFLKQKTNWKNLLAITISFIGILWISTHGNFVNLRFNSPTGVLLALSSTVFWSMFWILNMKDDTDDSIKLFISFITGFVLIFITILITGKLSWPGTKGLVGAIYIGVFEMGITFLLWLRALKFAQNTASISNLVFLSPFISLVFIHYIVGEHILPSTFIGLVMVVSGILLQRYFTVSDSRHTTSNYSAK